MVGLVKANPTIKYNTDNIKDIGNYLDIIKKPIDVKGKHKRLKGSQEAWTLPDVINH